MDSFDGYLWKTDLILKVKTIKNVIMKNTKKPKQTNHEVRVKYILDLTDFKKKIATARKLIRIVKKEMKETGIK